MALSKMMQHYFEVKQKHPDCIVFYRLGDFYEMFFDDAVKASQLLDLTLTGRDCGLEERAPMCGIPFHASETYIAKLVSLGEKVAICEQLSEPNKKELVKRDVVRIITAGTLTDDQNIDAKTNNFLCSVYLGDSVASFSWVDITTGEFFASKINGNNQDVLAELSDQLVKISPAQIISNNKAKSIFIQSPLVEMGILPRFEAFIDSEFDVINASDTIKKQLNVLSLSHLNIQEDDAIICSAGALISYLKLTQKHSLININSIAIKNSSESMMLDTNTIRNLELIKTIRDNKKYGTLLWLLDKTKTSMGARLLNSWILSPLNSAEAIRYRLEGVKHFYNDTVTRKILIDFLQGFRDISRISGKISNNNLLAVDCLNLSKSLSVIPQIKFTLSGINCEVINDINLALKDFSELCLLLDNAISNKSNELDGEFIKFGYNKELDELRDFSKNGKTKIAKIENEERERTGIKNLKIGYNRVFGYYIEITNSYKDRVPYHYIRKQTLANAERYVTEELKAVEENILSSEEKALKLEQKLFSEIKDILKTQIDSLKQTSEAIAKLDVLLSFATVARMNKYVEPSIVNSGESLEITDGRHPVVEATSKNDFIPNDTLLNNNSDRMIIVTGPNMAGKSTFMRQVAIITLMAHIGSFVPCNSAKIPITDKIFTRIGASDSLTTDQSTFMVEMSETAYILKNATINSLIILDEIGRGTSTFDGLSIAWSVVEYIVKNIKAKTLFATHYHELTELEGVLDGVKNYKVIVKELNDKIIFLRKILRGGANKSFGIEVAELAGVDKEVTKRAKEILKRLESADVTRNKDVDCSDLTPKLNESETERIIKELDLNNISPMQAFIILSDLYEKVTKE